MKSGVGQKDVQQVQAHSPRGRTARDVFGTLGTNSGRAEKESVAHGANCRESICPGTADRNRL